ncbi:putative F-box protein At1g67623 [Quercus lobata]|uniref:At2g35280-like TPR domain-containing protein n=1 Tax=Quercus lobata TaxID=97700 RepID=A0A7N2L7U5_QUELO|nr:putative F-box protein At1g67623 [Quercus lobata]
MAKIQATRTSEYKRTTSYKRKSYSSSIKSSLPKDLWTEVLGHVASTSLADLFNVKLSCKDFSELAEDFYIFQQASLKKIPTNPFCLDEKASPFLKLCLNFGNPESLFRQGVIDYFSLGRIKSGLEYLKRAADKGHLEATYVYGIILLCSEGELKQEGLRILSTLKRSNSGGLKECRKRTKTVMQSGFWVRNFIVGQRVLCCREEPCQVLKRKVLKRNSGWEPNDIELDADDDALCDACSCNCEVKWFSNILPGK